jgi:hypothetical protein
MRRPGNENAMGYATALITVAAITAAFAGIESHGDIWATSWTYITISLGGIGLLMATVDWALPLFDRGNRNASSHGRKNTSAGNPAGPDGEVEYLTECKEAGQELDDSYVTTTDRTGVGLQLDVDNSLPLIEECLELWLTGGIIRSRRVTPEKARDEAHITVPPADIVEDYRRALRESARGSGPPDEEVTRRTLQKLLLEVVPEPLRLRLAAAGAGETRQLAAVELRLMDSELEGYPWELIGDPAALRVGAVGVTVWRSTLSPPMPAYKGWTDNLLLTGTAAPLGLTPSIRDELAWITSELKGYHSVRVYQSPGIPASFGRLVAEHPPAAFHLVAHETGPETRSGADCGASFADLKISPGELGLELGRSGTWLAVFSCRDSAAMLSRGSRPPGYDIADQSGAAVIGMAGPILPYLGGLFATTLYRCLASGASAVHAYHAAVYRIRNCGPYPTMWSIPVMYTKTSNVVPFPVDDGARIRLGFVQIRLHAEALDRELQGLARASFQSSGEWAEQTATPMLRTDCIRGYLGAATREGDPADGRRRQRVNQAEHELAEALSATKTTLGRLSDLDLDEAGRRQLLQRLREHRAWHQRILGTLGELIEEAG